MSSPKRPHDEELSSLSKRATFDDNDDLSNAMEQVEFILSKDFTAKRHLFRLNLINCLYLFIKKYSPNFKLFSRALQAATKLYMLKVDFIRQRFINLDFTLKTNIDEIEDENDDFESQGKFLTRKNKKNSKKRSKSTIVTNLNSISTDKLETNCLIDPVFHQFSSYFDESNSDCLLLSHLQIDPLGVILFNAEDRLNFSSMPSLPYKKMNIKEFSFAPDLSICTFKKFRNFDFYDRNTELHQSITMDARDSFLHQQSPEILNQSCSLSEGSLTVEKQSEESKLFSSCIEPDHFVDILSEDDNHFFNANFLKYHFRNISQFYGPKLHNSKQQRQQSSKENPTFHSLSTNHYQLIGEESNLFDKSDRKNHLKEKINNDQNYINFIKNDYGFVPTQLRELFSKNSLTDHQSTIDQRDMQSDYNDESLNYSFNGDEDGFEYISPLDISYAEAATRINMRLLKNGMSNVIKTESIKASSSQLSHLFASTSGTSSSTNKVLSFTALNEQLDNYLNPNLRKGSQINSPTKFVTLLHLSNEKNLTLQPLSSNDELQDNHELCLKSDASDFNIFSTFEDFTDSSSCSTSSFW